MPASLPEQALCAVTSGSSLLCCDGRRSEYTSGRGASAPRAPQASVHAGAENVPPAGHLRRSPRLTSGARSNAGAAGHSKGANVLQDRTNYGDRPLHGKKADRHPSSACGPSKRGGDGSHAEPHPPTPALLPAAAAGAAAVGAGRAPGVRPSSGHAHSAAAPAYRSGTTASGGVGGPRRPLGAAAAGAAAAAVGAGAASRPPSVPRSAAASTAWTTEADDRLRWVTDYAQDIYGRLFREEAALLPPANFLDAQTEVNAKMRGILVDWLVEVHMKYRLRPLTLYLTVNILDRYLALKQVQRRRLQLVGVVALLVATKFEEITPLEVRELAYICDNAYTKEDIIQMECVMLMALEFQICTPTAAHFLDRLHRSSQLAGDPVPKELARYVAELALTDARLARTVPSQLAAASTLLALELLGREPRWPSALAQYSRYTEEELSPYVLELRRLVEGAATSNLQAVRRRYCMEQHQGVANLVSQVRGSA
eukprot:TRINITY_DN6370_c0_g1_i2.p1 TRINITY_DN6370_c0_g1~~TRINITY_DN6370_c0_g1_i2.p1  ORF type:complete len:483 (-),score=100.35 TRINITY_DN6370_c0_g1_i2:154-1602(-)